MILGGFSWSQDKEQIRHKCLGLLGLGIVALFRAVVKSNGLFIVGADKHE